MLLAMTATTSCMSSAQLDADITKALAYEDQLQTTVHGLEAGVAVMIEALPSEDQKAAYRDALQKFQADYAAIVQAKDDALIAAKKQNAERFDILPFIERWVPIVEEFIALGEKLKVQKALTDNARSLTTKLKAVR